MEVIVEGDIIKVGSEGSIRLRRVFVEKKRRYGSTEKPIPNNPSHKARVLRLLAEDVASRSLLASLGSWSGAKYQLVLAKSVYNLLFFRASTPWSPQVAIDLSRVSPIGTILDRSLRAVLEEAESGTVCAWLAPTVIDPGRDMTDEVHEGRQDSLDRWGACRIDR